MVQLWQSRPLQRGTAGSLSPAQQAAAEMIYNANRVYTDTKNNIQRVVNIVLNGSVSNAYKITSLMAMIGQGKKYTANNNPRTTLSTLFVQYDKATQSKKTRQREELERPLANLTASQGQVLSPRDVLVGIQEGIYTKGRPLPTINSI